MLLLVDGNFIIWRSWHATQFPPAVLLHAMRTVRDVSRRFRADRVVVAWDSHPTFREEIYPDYKKHRVCPERELVHAEISVARDVFLDIGLVQATAEGYEADDVIATYARQAEDEVIILSDDHDLCQLINPMCTIWRLGAQWGLKQVQKRYDLPPRLLVEFWAATGDPSDNIKGIPWIRRQWVVDWLSEYGSLRTVAKTMRTTPGGFTASQRKRLLDHLDIYERNLRLIHLQTIPTEGIVEVYFPVSSGINITSALAERQPEQAATLAAHWLRVFRTPVDNDWSSLLL